MTITEQATIAPQGFLAIEQTICPVSGEALWLWVAYDPNYDGCTGCGYVLPNGSVYVYGDGNHCGDAAEDIIAEMVEDLDRLSGASLDHHKRLLADDRAAA